MPGPVSSGPRQGRRGSSAVLVVTLLAGWVLSGNLAIAGTIDDVRAAGHLKCGISEGLRGFSERDGTLNWRGFDVDFCKAVAAAVLGDPTKVRYVPLSAEDRFRALAEQKIDLLSRNTTWTMSRDLALGLDFAGISYFDGQGFMVPALFGVSSPLQLEGARVCLIGGTTSESNAARYFAAAGLNVEFVRFEERAAARRAYQGGECDAYTSDRSALAAERSLLSTPSDHVVLSDIVSKEPLGPVTRDDDPRWSELVRWVLYGLINAEEEGLNAAAVKGARTNKAVAMGAPAVAALGLRANWLATTIAAVGNYGEIFERNLGPDTSLGLRRGYNALWTEGGLLYAPPMQ